MKASVESVVRISSCELSAHDIQELVNLQANRLVEPKDGEGTGESRFILSGEISEHESVEAHLAGLCSVLDTVQEKLALLPSEAEIDIWCTIYNEGEFVGFSIEKDILSNLAQLGVNLVFSYYEHSNSD